MMRAISFVVLFIFAWTAYSLYVFVRELPIMFDMNWKEKLFYLPVIGIAQIVVIVIVTKDWFSTRLRHTK